MFARWRDANRAIDQAITDTVRELSAADRQLRANLAAAVGHIDLRLSQRPGADVEDALLEVRQLLAPAGSSVLRPSLPGGAP